MCEIGLIDWRRPNFITSSPLSTSSLSWIRKLSRTFDKTSFRNIPFSKKLTKNKTLIWSNLQIRFIFKNFYLLILLCYHPLSTHCQIACHSRFRWPRVVSRRRRKASKMFHQWDRLFRLCKKSFSILRHSVRKEKKDVSQTDRQTDFLTNWQTDRLTDWSTGWLTV